MEWKDEIVEEVRKAREEYAAKFDYNLDFILQDLKEQEKKSNHNIVSLPPREADLFPLAKAS